MSRNTMPLFPVLVSALLIGGCSEDDSSSQPATALPPPEVQQEQILEHARKSAGIASEEEQGTKKEAMQGQETPVHTDNGVIYQDEIYRNWPYTEAPVAGDSAMQESSSKAMHAEDKGAGMQSAAPETHIVNAEARVFNPDILYINPGDTVHWQNMTSHNTVSVDGMIPDGAQPWRGTLGENLQITLDVEGIYAYVCEPHIGFGMVGLIIVGHPTTLDEVKKYAQENLQGPYRRLLGKLIKVNL